MRIFSPSSYIQSVQLEMGSSAEDSVLRRRKTERELCVRLEFSIYIIIMPGRRKSSRQRGSSFSGTITRSRAGKATILLLVDRQNAGPSKVLTTERLVFFRDHYEIESGQGNDTASVPRGRQTERPAVESPHDREASSFSGTITRSRAGKATILLLVQEVDRQNARPSKVLTTDRLVFFSDDESGQGNDTASGPRGRQTERPAVESPHYREASSFSGTITRSRAGKATILLLVQEVDRTPGRRKSSRQRGSSFSGTITRSTERLVFSATIRDGEGEWAHYLSVATFFWSSFTI